MEIWFRENMVFLRKHYGLSQVELAEQVGVKKSSISNYESGQSEPTISVALAIAMHFKVTLQALVCRNIKSMGIDNIAEDESYLAEYYKSQNEKLHQTIKSIKELL